MILFLSRRCSRPRHHFGQSTDFFCIRFSSYVFFCFFVFVSFLLRASQRAPQVFCSFCVCGHTKAGICQIGPTEAQLRKKKR